MLRSYLDTSMHKIPHKGSASAHASNLTDRETNNITQTPLTMHIFFAVSAIQKYSKQTLGFPKLNTAVAAAACFTQPRVLEHRHTFAAGGSREEELARRCLGVKGDYGEVWSERISRDRGPGRPGKKEMNDERVNAHTSDLLTNHSTPHPPGSTSPL